MPRRGPASPAAAVIGERLPASGVPKPRLARSAVRPERRSPPRPLAASPVPAPLASPRFSSPGGGPGGQREQRGSCSDASSRPWTTTTPRASTAKVGGGRGARRRRLPSPAGLRRPGGRCPAALRPLPRPGAARRPPARAAGPGRVQGCPSGRAESWRPAVREVELSRKRYWF